MKSAFFGCVASGVAALIVFGSVVAQPIGAAAVPVARAADDLTPLLVQPQRCGDARELVEPGPLRLGTVLRAVICGDAGVRRSRGLLTQAQASLDLVHAQAWPTWSISGGVDAERSSPTGWGTALTVQWVLFDFGRRSADTAQASQALAAVLDEQRVEVLNAVGNAALLYAAAQAASGRLDAATLNLRTAEDSARVAEARQGAGASTLIEVLQAGTALAQAKLEQSRAISQWVSARASLASAMRLPANSALEFGPDDPDDDPGLTVPPAVEALVAEARAHHPRVRAAGARLAQAQARADAVRAERWGKISVSGSSGRSRPSYGADIEVTASAQITWSVALFDGGQLDARRHDALGQIQTGEATLEDALRQVELQVSLLAQALVGEREVRRETKAVLQSAEATLRVATERFRLGVGNFSDVLLAQNAAANARNQAVESQANLRREQLRLAAAVGRFGASIRF